MDNWTKDGEEFSAIKVQASRVAILPHRIESVSLAPSQSSQNAQRQQNSQPVAQDPGPDFDDDIPV